MGIAQISRSLICRQGWPQGQVQNYSCALALGQGRAWPEFSHQQGSVNSSYKGTQTLFVQQCFPSVSWGVIQGQGDSGFGAQMKGSQGPQDKIPCVVAGWKEEGVSMCGGQ